MQAMTVLKRCRSGKEDIRRLNLRIRQRREAMSSIGGMRMDPNGGSKGTADPDKYGRMEAEIDVLERQKAEREDARRAEINSALILLEELDELESEILHRYYLMGDILAEISRTKNYDESYIRKKKKSGEDAMRRIPPERVAETLPVWYLKKWEEAER